MRHLFISYYPDVAQHGPLLIAALRATGCVVSHSPNPDDMANWYESGLASALAEADIFIAVICRAWDSSTWMGLEAEQALRLYHAGHLKNYFTYNPVNITIQAQGMLPYVLNRLPDLVGDAVAKILTENSS